MDSLSSILNNRNQNIRQVRVPQGHNGAGGARKSQTPQNNSGLSAHPCHHSPEDRVTLTNGIGGLPDHESSGRRVYP